MTSKTLWSVLFFQGGLHMHTVPQNNYKFTIYNIFYCCKTLIFTQTLVYEFICGLIFMGHPVRISKLTPVFHHLPSVGPKQFCVLAHLGRTHEVGNSYCKINLCWLAISSLIDNQKSILICVLMWFLHIYSHHLVTCNGKRYQSGSISLSKKLLEWCSMDTFG